jgi:hypothetical protein
MEALICETCGSGCGYRWPTASNDRNNHYYVERCDACDRFESDHEAQEFLLKRLRELWADDIKLIWGVADVGGMDLQPYIDFKVGEELVFGRGAPSKFVPPVDSEPPVVFSEVLTDGSIETTRKLTQQNLRDCPHFIIDPTHYRDNGICRCGDPYHSIMKEWGYTWSVDRKEWV